jgi:hypothetical protein
MLHSRYVHVCRMYCRQHMDAYLTARVAVACADGGQHSAQAVVRLSLVFGFESEKRKDARVGGDGINVKVACIELVGERKVG